jgi:hypothetical protein
VVVVLGIIISVVTREGNLSPTIGHIGLGCYAYDFCLEGAEFESEPGAPLVLL